MFLNENCNNIVVEVVEVELVVVAVEVVVVVVVLVEVVVVKVVIVAVVAEKLESYYQFPPPRADVDLPRNSGGRGLIELLCAYKSAIVGLSEYITQGNDKFTELILEHEKKSLRLNTLCSKRENV